MIVLVKWPGGRGERRYFADEGVAHSFAAHAAGNDAFLVELTTDDSEVVARWQWLELFTPSVYSATPPAGAPPRTRRTQL